MPSNTSVSTTPRQDEFFVIPDVAVLDEHILRTEDGNPVMKLDGPKLAAIAHRANQRARETGDLVPVVIGHTKDGQDELKGPPIVGYALDFKVGRLGRTGRKAVLATFKLFKHLRDQIRRFPRRSVELWLDDLTIDPISLLGATTPERDLGLLKLRAQGRSVRGRPFSNRDLLLKPRRYAKTRTPMDNENLVQEILAALEQTDVFQWAKAQMRRMGEDKTDTAAEAAEDENSAETADEQGLEEDLMAAEDDLANLEEDTEAEYEDEEAYAEGDKPVRECAHCGGDHPTHQHKAMYASSASGTNTFVADGMGKGKKGSNPEEHGKPRKSWSNADGDGSGGPVTEQGKKSAGTTKTYTDEVYPTEGQNKKTNKVYPGTGGGEGFKEAKKMSRSSSAIRLARMERAVAASQHALSDMRVQLRRATREKDLVELEAVGYDFDRAEELDLVQNMDDEQYAKHLERIKKRYQRAPVGGFGPDPFRYARSHEGRGKAPMTKERAREIADYATRRNISFAAALEEIGNSSPETY